MSDARADDSLSASMEEILQRRAASLALEPDDGDVSEGLSLLVFRVGSEWYAVKTGDVREIFQDYVLTPIPCVPEFIVGVVNIRGEILSVTDPARMMHLDATGGYGRLGLPAVVIANENVATALVVDEIGDIVEVPSESLEPPVSIIGREQAEFMVGSVFVSERMVGLLDVERMLQPIGS